MISVYKKKKKERSKEKDMRLINFFAFANICYEQKISCLFIV